MTAGPLVLYLEASMKVSPKRKGNLVVELSRVCGF